MGGIFEELTLLMQNYDALLISLIDKVPNQNVEFDGGARIHRIH